jgi:hypothetical protein
MSLSHSSAWYNCFVTEKELTEVWNRARTHLIVSQLAPTFLLITTVGLVPAIRSAGDLAVWATIGILLASGILGALVQFSAASEAQAVAADLVKVAKHSKLTKAIAASARGLDIARFVTPTIFIAIFVALCAALLETA